MTEAELDHKVEKAILDVLGPDASQEQKDMYRRGYERMAVRQMPLWVIKSGNLWIKTKRATLEPFRPNKAQLKVLNTIELLLESGKPIRILILKARQLGISTLIEAVIYVLTAFKENTNSLIMAHDGDSSTNVFEMSKLFQERIAHHLRPSTKKSNAKELVFDKTHSQILIDTANNSQAGRSHTFQNVHLSEFAFYDKPEELMAGLNQTVPNLPGTMIIKETTANGFNFFRDEWLEARDGKNDFVPIFLPWYWDDGYVMSTSEEMHLDQEEQSLRQRMQQEGIYQIERRLSWRRWAIKNLCRNSIELFGQEYPSSPEEAFLASGRCMFDKKVLIKRLQTIENAKKQGSWYENRANIIEVNNGFDLRYSDTGSFTFFEAPDDGGHYSGEYVVAGDASGGGSADYSVLEVRRKSDNRQMATFRGKVAPEELEALCYFLGSFFNNAVVAVENDKFGFAVNQRLKQRYGYVYQQERIESDGAVTSKFGWDTNSVTRPAMLAALEEDIRERALEINDTQFIQECLTFIYNEDKKRVEAESGTNDDAVMAMAINSMLRNLHPWRPTKTTLPGTFVADLPKNRGYGFKR